MDRAFPAAAGYGWDGCAQPSQRGCPYFQLMPKIFHMVVGIALVARERHS